MANNTNKRLGFIFKLEVPNETTITPEERSFVNEFDLIGDQLSLKRLQGESNTSYKQRLLDVTVHPGDPTYVGVVNSLTRDLGLGRATAMKISLKFNSAGEPIARNPRVDVLSNKVVLYSDWRPSGVAVIDKTIRFYQPTDEGFYLDDLVKEINSSIYFSASIYSGIRRNIHSTNLIRGSTDNIINNDPVLSSNKTDLSATYIVEDSWIFDELDIFDTEVTGSPSSKGEYKIDKINGTVESYSLPSGDFGVSYHYASFPLEVDYSMVKIYTLQDDDFVYELFEHETPDSGIEVNTLPNAEGSEIIHQLYKENEIFWGE